MKNAGMFFLLLFSLFLMSSHSYGANLALDWSTFVGGGDNEAAQGIAVDSSGCVYITGYTISEDFPVTSGVLSESPVGTLGDFNYDVFITKIGADGSALLYSTYLGGMHREEGNAIEIDGSGYAFIVGVTESTDFPTTSGAFSESLTGGSDAFVVKLNPAGSALSYSTYLGGINDDSAKKLIMNDSGNVYLTGYTDSNDFPTTAGAYDTTFNANCDAFVTRINTDGSALDFSTYLGHGTGWDVGHGIAIDSSANVYVTGATGSFLFPITMGAFQSMTLGPWDVFVSKFNSSCSNLIYSTFISGSSEDGGLAIEVDSAGCAYVAGTTMSPDFPVTAGAYDLTYNDTNWEDLFLVKLNPTATALEYSTYLGGSCYDIPSEIVLDSSGYVYVSGTTASGNFPVTSGVFLDFYKGDYFYCGQGFIAKLDGTCSLLEFSSFLGAEDQTTACGIVLDSSGNIYIGGDTWTSDFPTTAGAFNEEGNGYQSVYVSKLSGNPNISGTVTLEYPGWDSGDFMNLQYQIRNPGMPPESPLHSGTVTVSMAQSNPVSGYYGIVVPALSDGTYDVALKRGNRIADVVQNVAVTGGNAVGADLTLWSGDGDGNDNPGQHESGDNDIDIYDYFLLYYEYTGAISVSAGEGSDYDGNGIIDFEDYYGLYYGYLNNSAPANWYY